MKHLILLSLISISLISCTKDRLTANGDRTSEARQPGTFSGINSSGSTNVHLSYGTDYKVVIKGSKNLIPHFETNVKSGILYLQYENVNVRRDDLEIYVTMPLIDHISLSGSAEIELKGNFAPVDEFRASISGSGDLELEQHIDAKLARISISGSGNADLEALTAKRADIDISGSGEVEIDVVESLKARISGSGKIYFTGNPQLDVEVSGSGKVIKSDD